MGVSRIYIDLKQVHPLLAMSSLYISDVWQVGQVFSSYLKGGQEGGNDTTSLTAFILAALIEAGVTNQVNC